MLRREGDILDWAAGLAIQRVALRDRYRSLIYGAIDHSLAKASSLQLQIQTTQSPTELTTSFPDKITDLLSKSKIGKTIGRVGAVVTSIAAPAAVPELAAAQTNQPPAVISNVALLSPAGCKYILGFETLHNALPIEIGDCLDNQVFASNGDAVQHSADGLLVWRKADNWTAFTNGWMTWVNGPYGIQSRLNTDRFAYEHDQQTAPAPPITPNVQPTPAPPRLETGPAVLTLESVVNNPNVRYNGWNDTQIGYLRNLRRESIIRAQRIPGYGISEIGKDFLNSLKTPDGTDFSNYFLKAVALLDPPLVAASKTVSITANSKLDTFGWWFPEYMIDFNPTITSDRFLSQDTSERSKAMGISTDFKEWISPVLNEKLLFLGCPNKRLPEKGALYLDSIFVRRQLGDLLSGSDADWYANKYRQLALDYSLLG